MLGGSGFLGEMSLYAFPAGMLLLWAVFHVLAFTLVGAVVGRGLAAPHLRPLLFRVILLVIASILAVATAQSLGLVPATKLPHGRVGIGWNPDR